MSGKVRVYEVAKQLNLDPKQVVGLFQAIGVVDVRNHMSSVEPEQVERVKRHLEKQRTHDVVEERIRSDGRVIKRRAIAKAPTDVPSSAALPPSAPSVRSLDDVASLSQVSQETNGHTTSEPVMVREMERDAESGRLPVPEDRKSTRTLEPASTPALPRDRASARQLPVEPPPPPPPVVEPPVVAPPPAAERPTDDTVAAAEPAPEQEAPVVLLPLRRRRLRRSPRSWRPALLLLRPRRQ